MEELFSTFMGGILFPDCLFPAQGAVVLGLASYFGPIGGQFANFVPRMKALAKWEYIEYYAMDNGTVWVSMDVAQTWTIVFLMVVVFGLIAIYMANLLSALILYRQLRSLQSHMSAVSFKTHISVLYMLITQVT
ncbi:unnamed protein product, partial [Mesorhabditis belari]|uniref:Uncharacterized protein n=1 Tax=Mesorhabditis belari TaxID=2138241 RepID=A0AAF3EPL6_9BILA